MIDSLAGRRLSRSLPSLTLALVLLHSVGCLRNVDTSRLKCLDDATCPKNHTCAIPVGQAYGSCVVKSPDAGLGPDTQAALDAQTPPLALKDGPAATVDLPVTGGGAAVDAPAQGSPDTLSISDSGNQPNKLLNGAPCTQGSECSSSHCVDGVCCDGSCDGQCESCKEANSLGKCVAIKGAPLSPRAACGGTGTCKGQCDGANGKACTFPDGATVCTAPKCTGGMGTPASVCDGQGACTQPTSASCASGQCANDGSGKCSGSCTASSCGTGLFCNTAGVCIAKKAPGTLCSSKDECTSGFCADGVCCESACNGQCQACNNQGACVRVASGAPRSGHTPCTATDVTCGGTCDGTSDSCVYKGAETVCTTATCSNATTAIPASVCDGKGACTHPQSINCASSGGFCSVGQCASKQPNGSACQSDNLQCASGNCSNDTCCAAGQTGCNGTCVDLKTSAGNCGSCGKSCGGQTCCAGACVDTAVNSSNCGACGNSCGAQACMAGLCCALGSNNCGGSCCDSNHTCSGSTCTCKGYAASCGGCASWGFESNTTEGWIRTPTSVRSAVEKNGIQNLTTVTGDYAHSGGRGLALRVQIDAPDTNGAYFAVPLCPSGSTVNLPAGITLTAWMRFISDSGQTLPYNSIFVAEIEGPNGSLGGPDDTIGTSIPESIWFKFTHQFTDTSVSPSHLGFFWLAGSTWSGTIYLDDVQLKM